MPKYDGVVEAVRYDADGRVDVVRIYERRGPTWSDRIIIKRDELVKRIKAGKKYFSGTRQTGLAGTFEVAAELRLVGKAGEEVVITRSSKSECDRLEGVPIF
jgi:hypothetical protein